MSKYLKDLIGQTIAIKKKYRKIEPKRWEVGQDFMGLVKDIGDLSALIMQHQGFRELQPELKDRIGHELSDVVWSAIVLADDLDIDIEQSYIKTLEEIERRIEGSKL